VNDTSASLQLRDFDRAMAELSTERRETIRLVALEGMSYQAAAELLGVPMGTVRSRIARGRVLLRQMMDAGHRIAPARHARENRTVALAA
jgi:RNA polymerase sigma-70 factor, ECF subfamily